MSNRKYNVVEMVDLMAGRLFENVFLELQRPLCRLEKSNSNKLKFSWLVILNLVAFKIVQTTEEYEYRNIVLVDYELTIQSFQIIGCNLALA